MRSYYQIEVGHVRDQKPADGRSYDNEHWFLATGFFVTDFLDDAKRALLANIIKDDKGSIAEGSYGIITLIKTDNIPQEVLAVGEGETKESWNAIGSNKAVDALDANEILYSIVGKANGIATEGFLVN